VSAPAASVVNLSDALSRFVLPNLSASSSAHSVLVQIIHAMQDEPSHVTGVFLMAHYLHLRCFVVSGYYMDFEETGCDPIVYQWETAHCESNGHVLYVRISLEFCVISQI